MKYLLLLLPFFLPLTHLTSVSSWKKEEFRNCNQTPFCKRARSRKPQHCNLIATDVTISNGDLVAKLITPNNFQQNPDENSTEIASNPLILSISVYQNGILRMKIDEDPSHNPPKKRFQVPDVVIPEFETKKLWLQRYTTGVIDGDSVDSFFVYLFDGYEAVVRTDPLEVFVREQGSGKRVISFNSHGLFDFEQLRVKKEGDEWEKGLEVIRIRDLSARNRLVSMCRFMVLSLFMGYLNMLPTNGPGVEESEPYRLFNLDVFEYLLESLFEYHNYSKPCLI